MRQTFVFIHQFNEVAQPLELWNTFKGSLSEDFFRTHQRQDLAEALALRALQAAFGDANMRLADLGLPEPDLNILADINLNLPIFDLEGEQARGAHLEGRLNAEQRPVFDTVMRAVLHPNARPETRAFALLAPGGCGKTMVYKT